MMTLSTILWICLLDATKIQKRSGLISGISWLTRKSVVRVFFVIIKSPSMIPKITSMAFAQEDIELIQDIVQQAINNTPELKNANVRYEIDLRERTLRVEEELKHQRELMIEGFKQMDKRFEQVDKRFEQVDKRFEQVDRRFEQMHTDFNLRFTQIDKRFEQIQTDINLRFTQVDKKFEQIQTNINLRFTQVDKKFDQIQADINLRFTQMDKKFEQIQVDFNQRFVEMGRRMDRFMFWSLGVTVSSALFVVNYLK